MVAAACVFCSIKEEKVPASIVWRDDSALVFLDAKPLFKGHALVVPPGHVATLDELPAAQVGPFFATVQRIARAVQRGLNADGSFVAMNNVVSQSVPHLHVHVVPRVKGDGLRGFFWPRQRYADAAERDAFAARIRAALD
jgi:histidine triad (HIT) family protein